MEHKAGGEPVSLTGQIQAQDQVSLAFRLDGRLIERRVNVGDAVKPGQLVGRLDPQIQQNALRQAEAGLSAAVGQLTQARNTFDRLCDHGRAGRGDAADTGVPAGSVRRLVPDQTSAPGSRLTLPR